MRWPTIEHDGWHLRTVGDESDISFFERQRFSRLEVGDLAQVTVCQKEDENAPPSLSVTVWVVVRAHFPGGYLGAYYDFDEIDPDFSDRWRGMEFPFASTHVEAVAERNTKTIAFAFRDPSKPWPY